VRLDAQHARVAAGPLEIALAQRAEELGQPEVGLLQKRKRKKKKKSDEKRVLSVSELLFLWPLSLLFPFYPWWFACPFSSDAASRQNIIISYGWQAGVGF
jgi:hypothetical protein